MALDNHINLNLSPNKNSDLVPLMKTISYLRTSFQKLVYKTLNIDHNNNRTKIISKFQMLTMTLMMLVGIKCKMQP